MKYKVTIYFLDGSKLEFETNDAVTTTFDISAREAFLVVGYPNTTFRISLLKGWVCQEIIKPQS